MVSGRSSTGWSLNPFTPSAAVKRGRLEATSSSSRGVSGVEANNLVVYIDGNWGDGSVEREILIPRGYELVLAGCKTDDEVVVAADGARAILNSSYWMGSNLFERLPALKVVVRGGVGYDNIDVDAATEYGVIVCNVVDYG